MTLLAELYDLRRFPHPRALMAIVGLVPSEAVDRRSSASRGGLTRPGNSLMRRMLIQAAWHYHHRAAPRCRALRRRRTGQSAAVLAIADQGRAAALSTDIADWVRDRSRNRWSSTAIARELVGFIWAELQLPEAQLL